VSPADADAPLALRITSRGLDDREIAAVQAVLSAAVAEQQAAHRPPAAGPSAWERGTRGLRSGSWPPPDAAPFRG
jgi:Acyl-CoA carboxylase epsilon subunit